MHRTIATPQLAQRAESSTLHYLTRGESVDLTLLVVTGWASGFAVLLVYLLIIKNVIRSKKQSANSEDLYGQRQLFEQPMDIYMFSLLASDVIHALGAAMNMRWIALGKSEIGTFCTVQGVVNQMGPVAFALNTIVIAIATFNMVWCHNPGLRLRVPCAVVAAVWIVVGLVVGIPAGINRFSDHYWVPEPLWCTVGKAYKVERLMAKYLYLWIALCISILFYILLALLHQGHITVHGGAWWRFSIHRQVRSGGKNMKRPFLSMIVYPLSNAALIIPLSVVRWVELAGGSHHITPTDRIVVAIIFSLSGVTNVLLLLYIRPNLLLLGRDQILCKHCGAVAEPRGSIGMVSHSAEEHPMD